MLGVVTSFSHKTRVPNIYWMTKEAYKKKPIITCTVQKKAK